MPRDFCGDMRRVIDAATAGQDGYVAAAVAAEIVDKLRATDPGLLEGWLDDQAVTFVRQSISARDHSIRTHVRHVARSREFGEATEQFQGGETEALHGFLTMPFTLADHVRKPLGAMTHDDLLFVQADHQNRANESLFYVSVMGALAERVTEGVVLDHFNEVQLQNIFSMFH